MIPGYTHYCFGCGEACEVIYTWGRKLSRCCGFGVTIAPEVPKTFVGIRVRANLFNPRGVVLIKNGPHPVKRGRLVTW